MEEYKSALLKWTPELRAVQATGVLSLAHLVLTSLITTSGGSLIAVLSFAAQAKSLSGCGIKYAMVASTFLGVALASSIFAALAGYVYQLTLTYGKERTWIWALAFCFVLAAILCLIGGGIAGLQLLRETISTKV